MHPHFGCDKRMDKLPVSLECVAQDLEANIDSNSENEDQNISSSSEAQQDILTITELSDCSVDEASNEPEPQVSINAPDFVTMANFSNNGFTFPSPSVVAYTQSMTMHQPCLPFALGSSNGIKQYQPGICSTACSTIQFPTPAISCSMPMPGTSGSSSYCVPSGRVEPLTWQPTIMQIASGPSVNVPMSGMPSSMPQPEQVQVATQSGVVREQGVKGKKKHLKPATSMCVVRQGKRKAENQEGDASRKVHINEARMAARMQELHLDNNNLEWHPNLEEEPWYSRATDDRSSRTVNDVELENLEEDVESGESDSEQGSKGSNGLPCLELSKELQLGLKTKELLPRVLMEHLHKPSMQLVLWKPPGDFVKDMVQEVTNPDSKPSSSSSLPEDAQLPGSSGISQTPDMDIPEMDVDVRGGMDSESDSQSMASIPAASTLPIWSLPAAKTSQPPDAEVQQLNSEGFFDSVDDTMDL